MNDKEYFEYLISCGFTENEANQKFKEKEIMKKIYFSGQPKEYIDKSTSTYKRIEKRMQKEMESFLGIKK